MNLIVKGFAVLTLLMAFSSQAAVCPDPQTSSLQWGEPPVPWVVTPTSPNEPQGEASTRFVNASILYAGSPRGIVCNYENSVGFFSIWQPVPVSILRENKYLWIENLGGFMCMKSLEYCAFEFL